MGAIYTKANSVFRDGSPTPHNPIKADIRDLFKDVDNAVSAVDAAIAAAQAAGGDAALAGAFAGEASGAIAGNEAALLALDTKADRIRAYHGGVDTDITVKLNNTKHFYDFCTEEVRAQVEAGEDVDVTAELQAFFAGAGDGYCGVFPQRELQFSEQLVIGDGTSTSISTVNNCCFVSDGNVGMDDGYFGALKGTRLKYIGPRDTGLYAVKIAGPIAAVELLGIVIDGNGRAGYCLELAHLCGRSHVKALLTRYVIGAGKAYVHDVPTLPSGVTVGFMDNHLELWWRRPTDALADPTQAAFNRAAKGFQFLGGPINNQGFSRNRISCWGDVGGDAGTYAMEWNFIDNNRFDHVFLTYADGAGPGGANVGKGLRLVTPSSGPFFGFSPWENHIAQAVILPPYEVVDDTGAAATLRNAQFRNMITMNNVADGSPEPPEGFIWADSRGSARGSVNSQALIFGRSLGSLNATSPWFYSPSGPNIGGVNRFEPEMQVNQVFWLTGFGVTLGNAPGVGASRTFTVHVNGSDTAFTVTFGAAELGTKKITTPASLNYAGSAGVSVKETHTGTPVASGASWTISIEPQEAW